MVAVGSLLAAILAGCGSAVPKGWQRAWLPAGLSEVSTVSCSSPTRCVATGEREESSGEVTGYILSGTGDMSRWSAVKNAVGVRFDALDCTGSSQCIAVGEAGQGGASAAPAPVAYLSRDRGSTWREVPVNIGGAGELVAVTCGYRLSCVAVGNTLEQTAFSTLSDDGGATWNGPIALPGLAAVAGIACSTARRCIAVGGTMTGGAPTLGAMVGSFDGGQHWSLLATPPGLGAFTSVSCDARSICAAGGAEDIHGTRPSLMQATDGSRSWKRVALPEAMALPLTTVGCATKVGCVAGGPSGHLLVRVHGADWADRSIRRIDVSVLGLSCPTDHLCITVGIVVKGSGPSGVILVNRQGT